jgi:hypothetical protein
MRLFISKMRSAMAEAREPYERLIKRANDVGLFAEEIAQSTEGFWEIS